MLRNYLIIAWRNLLRHKLYSLINILGLAVGMACSLLILQYVRYELTYDHQHLKSDRIYRVLRETQQPDGGSKYRPYLSGILGEVMKEEIPEIEKTTRLWTHGGVSFTAGTRRKGASISIVDPTFFDIFDFQLIDGTDPGQALQQPGSILLMDMGRNVTALFGDEDPVGETVILYDGLVEGEYTIAGIMEDRTTNEVFRWDFITTHLPRKFPQGTWDQWDPHASMTQTITQLHEDADISQVESKLNELLANNLGIEIAQTDKYHLQKFDRIRLFSEEDFDIPARRTIQHLYLYTSIVILVVFVACINFINLMTARAGRRAREIGIRKVTGALRSQLIQQFLIEAILVALLAGIIAVDIAHSALPTFNQIAWGTTLDLRDWPWVLAFSLIVGFMAGIYPAFYLSRQQPVHILKGLRNSMRSTPLRKILVVSQFTISTFLIISALIAYLQLNYIRDRKLGFDAEGLIALNILSHDLMSKEDGERVKAEFLHHPNILAATRQGWQNFINTAEIVVTRPDNEQQYSIYQFHTDDDFLATYRVSLERGRNFRNGRRDSEFIINETAARILGWEDPIGQPIRIDQQEGIVVGVVENFHFQSLHHTIHPLILRNWGGNYLHLRIRETDIAGTIAFMEETWMKLVPNVAFSFQFLDDRIAGSYRADRQDATISFFAAGIAVFVAILGLVGLTAYATEQRAKELSIRKVLGASIPNLVSLLTNDLLRLVILANVLAWPLAFYLTRNWLDQFAFRIEFEFGIFLVGSAFVIVLALLITSGLAWRTASANPVEALKSE
ncbi:FtsX-like permease family protein [Candidatus Bathyarchaeota archaeon]|jgi:putative ABC transport system permease protein|nr:FtsX-like permease family protein [Candidatus Bathyarchaeota archaeon]